MTAHAYVGVGSNIAPALNITAALGSLSRHCRVAGVSTFYRTRALTDPATNETPHPDNDYYNGVFLVHTDIPPLALKFEVLRAIEEDLGRVRSPDRYKPRPIDLDLLLYGSVIMSRDGLTLPDPAIMERPFVALPLVEIDKDLVLPDTHVRIADMASSRGWSPDSAGMVALEQFTDYLRRMASDEQGTRGHAGP